MAKLMSRKGFAFHATTIAKIEAGNRQVEIVEAVAIAELFEMSLDSLIGHKPVAGGNDLAYALSAFLNTVHASSEQLWKMAEVISEQLDDLPEDFDGYDTLTEHGHDAHNDLTHSYEVLDELEGLLISLLKQQADERPKQEEQTSDEA
jgi:hypothetical protein